MSYTSIAVGPDSLPVIAYASDRSLKVVKRNDEFCAGGGETFTTVDHSELGLGYYLSMVHGADEQPNNIVGTHTSIAIGSDGLPVVSYHDHQAETLKVLKCGTGSCGRP